MIDMMWTVDHQIKSSIVLSVHAVKMRCMTFADCRLQTADCRPQTADCSLQIVN